MGYFVSGFKTSAEPMMALDKIFGDLVSDPLRLKTLRLASPSACLISYAGDKVIPEITISCDDRGSWLAVLGTPLIDLKSENQKREFLEKFLADPAGSLCHELDGNFAVFAYDAVKDKFIAGTDFNNTTPIYYSITSEGVYFASHELTLAKFLRAEVDQLGFYHSIHLGLTWGKLTRFRNISKTLPCQLLVFDNKANLEIKQYWRPEVEKLSSDTFNELIEAWISTFGESVWKFYECSGRKPVMVDFTGGEDSRLMLAQCHALGIPFRAHVVGLNEDIDVIIAKRAAKKTGFDLMVRPKHWITTEQLLANAIQICLGGDAYKEFTISCVDFATNKEAPLDDYRTLLYCGVPGGEAFRGSYYLRGKALCPSRNVALDYKFFVKMKYLLDYHPGLLRYSDNDGIESIYGLARMNLADVESFPIGIQIDHMLRIFQTCSLGLKYKNPLYLPFATRKMTQLVYSIPPRYKRGSKLTRASTEVLYPELAVVKTQKGVPTIRRTLWRLPRFLPEYVSLFKGITSGVKGRLFKWTASNKWYYNQRENMFMFSTLLNTPPYSTWLSSAGAMRTGPMYNADVLNPILEHAKAGTCRFLPLLGRVVSQELAFRWVSGEADELHLE
jgi:hypothetical protein